MTTAQIGGGMLVIWNGITAEGESEYYRWHDAEHVPERLSVPGFLRGRRFVCTDPSRPREYLTTYETASVGTLGSAPYLAQLERATAWGQRVQLQYRDMIRRVFRVAAHAGHGEGGTVLTARFALAPGRQSSFQAGVGAMLARLVEIPGVVAARALETDAAATQRIRGAVPEVRAGETVPWLLLVECGGAGIAASLAEGPLAQAALYDRGAVREVRLDAYLLQISLGPESARLP